MRDVNSDWPFERCAQKRIRTKVVYGSVWEMETPGDRLLCVYKKGPEKFCNILLFILNTRNSVSSQF